MGRRERDSDHRRHVYQDHHHGKTTRHRQNSLGEAMMIGTLSQTDGRPTRSRRFELKKRAEVSNILRHRSKYLRYEWVRISLILMPDDQGQGLVSNTRSRTAEPHLKDYPWETTWKTCQGLAARHLLHLTPKWMKFNLNHKLS